MAERNYLKLHENNLKEIKAALRHPLAKKNGGVWVHADGNIYMDKFNSDDRKIFTNPHPDNNDARVRVFIATTDAPPMTLEELDKRLLKAYQAESKKDNAAATVKEQSPRSLGAYTEEDEVSDEVDGGIGLRSRRGPGSEDTDEDDDLDEDENFSSEGMKQQLDELNESKEGDEEKHSPADLAKAAAKKGGKKK